MHKPYSRLYLDPVRENDPEYTKLEFNARHFGDDDALALAEAMKNNTSLQKICFTDSDLTDVGFSLLVATLQSNTSVTELDFEGNPITSHSAQELVVCLREHNHTIIKVNLRRTAAEDADLLKVEEGCILNQQPRPVKDGILALTSDTCKSLLLADPAETKPYTEISTRLVCEAIKPSKTITLLDFSNNNIGDAKTEKVAQVLAENRSLTLVRLQNNQISCTGATYLADSLKFNTSVTELDLKHNLISDKGALRFLETFRENSVLSQLNLELNNVSVAARERLVHNLLMNAQPFDLKRILPEVQLNYISIKRIILSDIPPNSIVFLNDMSCRVLYNALRTNTSVTYLDFSNNKIGDDGVTFLADLLRLNDTITTLLLNNNQITDAGARALIDALKSNHAVKRIEARDNSLSSEMTLALQTAVELNTEPLSFKKFAPHLADNDPAYTRVDLSENSSNRCTANTCRLLCNCLMRNTHVTELTVSNNPDIGVDGLALIAEMLAENGCPCLKFLDVSHNELGDDGAIHFANMLHTNRSLRKLIMRNNGISKCAVEFVVVLSFHNHFLTTLDLGGNPVPLADYRDVTLLTRLNAQPRQLKQYVLELLANCPLLTELNLCESESTGISTYRFARRYDDDSVGLVCDALKSNNVLTALNLTANNITDIGAKYISDMLLQNSTLMSLTLDYNSITDSGCHLLIRAIQRNERIQVISCDNNPIHPESRRMLNEALSRKKDGADEAAYDRILLQCEDMGPGAETERERDRKINSQILVDALRPPNVTSVDYNRVFTPTVKSTTESLPTGPESRVDPSSIPPSPFMARLGQLGLAYS